MAFVCNRKPGKKKKEKQRLLDCSSCLDYSNAHELGVFKSMFSTPFYLHYSVFNNRHDLKAALQISVGRFIIISLMRKSEATLVREKDP